MRWSSTCSPGSGAVGIEALSRGAAHCTFVERDRAALRALDANLDVLGLLDRSRVLRSDAVGAVAAIDADVVFADPPYDFDRWDELLAAVRADVVVAEAGRAVAPPTGWEVRRHKRYGRTHVTQLERRAGARARRQSPRRPGTTTNVAAMTAPRVAPVLYPGSFDPLHVGHVDVVAQAVELFGSVVVAVMYNPDKATGLFSIDERVDLARASLADLAGVRVEPHTGLAVQAAARVDAHCIVKGLRTPGDFEIEQQMAHNNHAVTGIRTVYVPCAPALGYISSRFVREIARYGGDIGHLVAPPVAAALRARFADDTAAAAEDTAAGAAAT